MKKGLKLLALLLALFTVFSVACSCTNNVTTDTTAAETQPVANLNNLVLVRDGISQYTVVRAEGLANDSEEVKCALNVKNAIKEYLADGQNVGIITDYIAKDATHDAGTLEILVGNTNYDETATALDGVEGGGWAIRVVGNKICIVALSDEGITRATDAFVNLIKTNALHGENGLYNVSLGEEAITLSGKVERAALEVPQPEGYTSVSFYKTSLEGDEAIYTGATREMYDAYIQKLRDEGYEFFSQTEMNGCPFATLYNEIKTIHTGFYANENTIRSIVETFDTEDLYGAPEDNQYKAITTTNIAEIGVTYFNTDTQKYQNTGACVVIRLADGRFIIFDGGHYMPEEMPNLIKYLKYQAKDYMAQNNNKITVAAWFITHPHSDHWGPMVGYYDQLRSNNIIVENIIYNFLSEEELQRAHNLQNCNYSNGRTNDTLPGIAKFLKANVITCHVGNTYYIANMKLEVLYTIESYCQVPNDLNALSPVMKMSFYDPATGELMNTFMHVGDCTGYGLRCAANTFQKYLLTDIGQIPHHGAGTKGDDGGVILFFRYNQPATVLWTAGNGCYNAYANNSYIQAAINKSQNRNFKEVFMSDVYGRVVILNLPYTPGNAQIINDYRIYVN